MDIEYFWSSNIIMVLIPDILFGETIPLQF